MNTNQSGTRGVMTAVVGAAPLVAAAGVVATATGGPIVVAAIGATGVALAARAIYQHRGGRDSTKKRQREIRRAHRMNSTSGGRGGVLGKLGKNGGRGGAGTGAGGKKAGAGKGAGLRSRSVGLASKNKGTGKVAKPSASKTAVGAKPGGFGKRTGGGLGKSSGASKRGGGSMLKSSGANRRSGTGKGLSSRSGGASGGRGGLLGKLGKNARTRRSAARHARAGDRMASKAVKRSRRATMWRELRRIGATMRSLRANRKSKKKNKDGKDGSLWQSVGHGIRTFSGWIAAAAVATWGIACLAGKTVGKRARGLWSDIASALKLPFEGLGTDLRRIRSASARRIKSEAHRLGLLKGSTTSTNTNNKEGDTVSDLNLPPRSSGPATNLTPLIEAIQEGGALGGGEQPHAKVVHQWHRDLETLLVAIKERVSADAEIAAETLPSEGSAHEITSSLADVLDGASAQTAESTHAWELCQGSRLTRLYSDDARESAWDRSTSPD